MVEHWSCKPEVTGSTQPFGKGLHPKEVEIPPVAYFLFGYKIMTKKGIFKRLDELLKKKSKESSCCCKKKK